MKRESELEIVVVERDRHHLPSWVELRGKRNGQVYASAQGRECLDTLLEMVEVSGLDPEAVVMRR